MKTLDRDRGILRDPIRARNWTFGDRLAVDRRRPGRAQNGRACLAKTRLQIMRRRAGGRSAQDQPPETPDPEKNIFAYVRHLEVRLRPATRWSSGRSVRTSSEAGLQPPRK
jgi:hypothetical protein